MKLLANKKIKFIILPLIIVVGLFVFGPKALANPDWAGEIVGGLIGVIISALGLILILLVKGLMIIASFQTFIGAAAVVQGWVIVRDLCNMFFVVVLLIISFGTILHLEEYSYKKWLPKLILMAVLINFSKTICGILIDVSQVVMLSFVNAFKDVGGAYLLDNLGISKIVTLAKSNEQSDFWTIVGAYVLGLIYVIIAIVVIAAMLAMLAMRIVMIWIYVVLSPLAYLLSAFPGGSKFASQWWSQFTQNLIVGPVLAFFIWLSFAALQQGNIVPVTSTTSIDNANNAQETAHYLGETTASSSKALAATEASTPQALINFVIAIGMLIGGLKITQEIGGVAAGVAGKVSSTGFNYLKKKGADAGKWAVKSAKNRLGDVRDAASEAIGVDLNFVEGHKRKKQQQEENRQQRRERIRDKTLTQATEGESWLARKAALFSTGDVAYQNIKDHKFFQGGSPTKNKDNLDAIIAEKRKKEDSEQQIAKINNESSRIITVDELRVNKARVQQLEAANKDLAKKKDDITNDAEYKELSEKESTRVLMTEDETKKLQKKKTELDEIKNSITKNTDEINTTPSDYLNEVSVEKLKQNYQQATDLDNNNNLLKKNRAEITGNKDYQDLLHKESIGKLTGNDKKKLQEKSDEVDVIDSSIEKNEKEAAALRSKHVLINGGISKADDEQAKEKLITKNRFRVDKEEQSIKGFDSAIDKFTRALSKNKLSEVQSAKAEINATMEAEASKKIANFSNPDQLVSIMREAMEQKDTGLIAACYKKLAKTSNYNDIHRDMNIGTGYEGMIEMSKHLQSDGGMTEQSSRALVAEVGEICKSVGHFEAFGAMTMNKAGQWQETGKDEQEANIFSEKAKLQVQQYVRNINRLGNGSYRNGQPHNAENWDISRSTLALYASKDNKYADEMSKTGNINAIQFIGANRANIKRLRDAGAKEVAKVIEEICNRATADVSNPLDSIRTIKV